MGSEEQKERDRQARSTRDEYMKRRRQEQAQEERERQARIMDEVQKIQQQAKNRKSGWF